MPLPAAAVREQRRHRIADLSFSAGRALCGCGVLVTANPDPTFDRDEALELAWLSHRRDVGLMRPLAIGFDREGAARSFRLTR